MNRQIRACTFNVLIDDGSNLNVVNGFPVNVNTYSGSYTYRPYYHTGNPYDEAITGRLRSQLGGYRFEVTLSWERLIDQDPLISVLNNAFTSTNGEVVIQFHPDNTNSYFENVVVEDVVLDSQMTGTVMRQPIMVRLMGRDVRADVPNFYKI